MTPFHFTAKELVSPVSDPCPPAPAAACLISCSPAPAAPAPYWEGPNDNEAPVYNRGSLGKVLSRLNTPDMRRAGEQMATSGPARNKGWCCKVYWALVYSETDCNVPSKD